MTVNFEPMSRKGWTDAHPRLTSPHLKVCSCFSVASWSLILPLLQERIVNAYTKIHAQGILHGDVSLRNVTVEQRGDKVHILNFRRARALVPFPAVGLAACTQKDLEFEMRYVKFIIDYLGAQKREETLWVGSGPESRAAWSNANALRSKRSVDRKVPGQPHEVWDTENGEWRVFDTRNTWFPIQEPRPSRAAILPKTFLDDCVPSDDEWLDTVAEMIEADARQHQTRERRQRLERIQSRSPSMNSLDTIPCPSPTFSEPLLASPIITKPSGEANNSAPPSPAARVFPTHLDNGPVQQKREQLVTIDAAIWARKGEAEDIIKARSSNLLRMIQDLEESDLDELILYAKSHRSVGIDRESLRCEAGDIEVARLASKSAPRPCFRGRSSTSTRTSRLFGRRDGQSPSVHRASDSWHRPRSSPQDPSLRNPSPSQAMPRPRRSFLAPRIAPKSAMLPPATRPSSSSARDSRIRRPRGPLHFTEFPPVQREATSTRRGDMVISSPSSSRHRARSSNLERPFAPAPFARSPTAFSRPPRSPTAIADHDQHRVPKSSSIRHRNKEVTSPREGRRNFERNGSLALENRGALIHYVMAPSTHRAASSSRSFSSSSCTSEDEVEVILTKSLESSDAMTPDISESSTSADVLSQVVAAHSESSCYVLSASDVHDSAGSAALKRKRDDDGGTYNPDATDRVESQIELETSPVTPDRPLAKESERKESGEPAAKRIRFALAFFNLFTIKQ